MIDRVEEIDPEHTRIRCRSTVPFESTIFQGHFPGHPILPGVLLVEVMAQTSGYLLLARTDFAKLPFLIQISSAKLRSFVEPGAELSIAGVLEHDGSGFAVTKGEVTVEGAKVAEAELRFRTLDFPSDELRDVVMRIARTAGLKQ